MASSSDITNYLLGDFNFVEFQLNRNNPSKSTIENDNCLNKIWEKIKDKYNVVDSFRILNPKLRRYSYIKNIVRSRIDRIYLNKTESGKTQNTNFSKTLWDDHKMYRINIFDNIDIGPGQWMLNIKLLSDKEFRKTLENEWMEFRKLKNSFRSLKDWWDAAKNYVRTIAVSYAQKKTKVKRQFFRMSKIKSKYLNLKTF